MNTQFDPQGGYNAPTHSPAQNRVPDADVPRKGVDSSKGHIALILGIVALVIAIGLIPYVFFLDICVDVANVLVAEALQSADDFNVFLMELGFPSALAESLYNVFTTAKISRFLTLMGLSGLAIGLISLALSCLGISLSVRKPKPSTATAALVVSIVAFVICFLTILIGMICLL